MRVLVTGADGFVGRALCRTLLERGHSVRAAVFDVEAKRRLESQSPTVTDFAIIGDISAAPAWAKALTEIEGVVHLAALVHRMGKSAPSPDAYRQVNVNATQQLAQAGIERRVRRMVFLSSVKVNGECSGKRSFTEEDVPQPEDAYSVSKLEAERVLERLSKAGDLGTVIVRPPLVYGPGVRANFRRLLGIVQRVKPLIVPRIVSKRSLIGIGNLTAFLSTCLEHPAAANQTFLVSDNEDVTSSELVQRLASAMGNRSYVAPISEDALRWAARMFGMEEDVKRMVDPLTICPQKAMKLLNWKPPFNLDSGLALTVQWYLGMQTRVKAGMAHPRV